MSWTEVFWEKREDERKRPAVAHAAVKTMAREKAMAGKKDGRIFFMENIFLANVGAGCFLDAVFSELAAQSQYTFFSHKTRAAKFCA